MNSSIIECFMENRRVANNNLYTVVKNRRIYLYLTNGILVASKPLNASYNQELVKILPTIIKKCQTIK